MSMGQSHDPLLNAVRKDKAPVTIYLVNGIKLSGLVRSFDEVVVIIEADGGRHQMIYKHAISTIVPTKREHRETDPS